MSQCFIAKLYKVHVFYLPYCSTFNKITCTDDAKREGFCNEALATEAFGHIQKRSKPRCMQPHESVGYKMK